MAPLRSSEWMNLPVTSFQPSTVTELRMSTGSVVTIAGAPATAWDDRGRSSLISSSYWKRRLPSPVGEAGPSRWGLKESLLGRLRLQIAINALAFQRRAHHGSALSRDGTSADPPRSDGSRKCQSLVRGVGLVGDAPLPLCRQGGDRRSTRSRLCSLTAVTLRKRARSASLCAPTKSYIRPVGRATEAGCGAAQTRKRAPFGAL